MTDRSGNETVQEVLDFWFAEDTRKRWYDSTPAFDRLCRERFGALVDQAAAGRLDAWQATADGALALCLLLDQLPRNMFRGTPRAFETDAKAVAVAGSAIDRGLDQALDLERRKILYLPFMHSVVLADQERAVLLYQPLGDDYTLSFATDHADIIRRFGRFPHRNAILGRDSTAAERAFLEDGAKDYGQSSKPG
jgi:uncharacterized protein (DUF924 family)